MTDVTHNHQHVHPVDDSPSLARHVARLLIGLYHLGTPSHSLFEGETRQVESLDQLRRFDFWLREPGHLALALLHVAAVQSSQAEAIRGTLAQMLIDDAIDHRRVQWSGTPLQSLPDLHEALSFLSSRALVSDRPSFSSGPHQVVLEGAGIEFVQRILENCPLFGWYNFLGETIARFWKWLAPLDLGTMPYLPANVSPAQMAAMPLLPIVRAKVAAPPDLNPSP